MCVWLCVCEHIYISQNSVNIVLWLHSVHTIQTIYAYHRYWALLIHKYTKLPNFQKVWYHIYFKIPLPPLAVFETIAELNCSINNKVSRIFFCYLCLTFPSLIWTTFFEMPTTLHFAHIHDLVFVNVISVCKCQWMQFFQHREIRLCEILSRQIPFLCYTSAPLEYGLLARRFLLYYSLRYVTT